MANLLVVDDSIDVAELISEMLEREGHTVSISHDGRQAIARINAGESYDVIITDLIMPELDGVGFLKYMQKTGNKTPVLVLSGGGVTISSREALKSVGTMAVGVLAKPIKCAELLEKIETAMC